MKIEDVIEKLEQIRKIYGNNIEVYNVATKEEVEEVNLRIDGYIYVK